jgi:hypothetical protein
LDRYPPKDESLTVKGPPVPTSRRTVTATPSLPKAAESSLEAPPKPEGLIALERPFDVDEFAQMLGETQIRVTVPREALADALRRVTEFMNFGIYVYTIRVQPAPAELLKQFVLELQRVDFSPEKRGWVPFQEQGASDSPFGPTGAR